MSVRSTARRVAALRQHRYPPDHPLLIEAHGLWVEAQFARVAEKIGGDAPALPPDVRARLVALLDRLGDDPGRAA